MLLPYLGNHQTHKSHIFILQHSFTDLSTHT